MQDGMECEDDLEEQWEKMLPREQIREEGSLSGLMVRGRNLGEFHPSGSSS